MRSSSSSSSSSCNFSVYPLLDICRCLQLFLFRAASIQLLTTLFKSSVHCVECFARLHLSALGAHLRILLVYLVSLIIAVCSVHIYFPFAIHSMTSSTPVLLWMSVFRTEQVAYTQHRSFRFMLSSS